MVKASAISIERAQTDKLFYIVANVAIYRPSDGRCLLLKRSETEAVHPSCYAMPGGKLEWGDLDLQSPTRMNGDVIDFENTIVRLLKREAKEEAGVEIGNAITFINDVAFVRPDGIPVLLIKFMAPYLGGEVVLEEGSFTDHIWVNAQEARELTCIQGIPEELEIVESLIRRLA